MLVRRVIVEMAKVAELSSKGNVDRAMRIATMIGPPIARIIGPGVESSATFHFCRRFGGGDQATTRRFRRPGVWRLATGAEGGGPSFSTSGFRRER